MATRMLKNTFTSNDNSDEDLSSTSVITSSSRVSSHCHQGSVVRTEESKISTENFRKDVNFSQNRNWIDNVSYGRIENRLLGKDDFESDCLASHNEHRKQHGSEPLKINKTIAKVSKQWAEELARRDKLEYSNNTHYGENVFCGWSEEPGYQVTAKEVVAKWYSQIIDFEFGAEPKVLKAGHFSQLIWKDTTEIGVGQAKSKSGKVYVVVNYNPPGNIAGQFSSKVPPPGFRSMPAPNKNKKTEDVQVRHDEKASVKSQDRSSQASQKTSDAKSADEKRTGGFSDLTKKLKNLTTGGDDASEFERECLAAHNEFRAKHGVPPLKLNKKISKFSDEWARHLTTIGRMEHRKQSEYGENIFYSWSSDPNHSVNGRQPVDSWYSEIKDHTFGRDPSSLKSGHFTQVIWRDSKELGVAWAKDKTGRIFVVANYLPPGNFVGSFTENVPPPLRN